MSEMADFLSVEAFGFAWDERRRVIKAESVSAVEAAAAIVRTAELRAARILQDAEQVYRDRHREGYETGMADAKQAALERVLAETSEIDAHFRSIEDSLADMMAATLRRLVGDFTEDDKVRITVQGALQKFRRTTSVRISLHPDAPARKEEIEAVVRAMVPSLQFIDFIDDPSLPPEDVLVETPIGRVQTCLDKEIELIGRALAGEAAGANSRD